MKKINKALTLIAGPCSLDYKNTGDIYKISEIKIINNQGKKQPAVFGTRVVGLKSRTALTSDGKGMGIDYQIFMENLNLLLAGKNANQLKNFPSVKIAAEIIQNTGMLVATEIMSPLVQLPIYERLIPQGKLMIWNPAVNQLGWPVMKMGHYAKKNQWYIGLKNPKWLNMEKTWLGLVHFAGLHTVGMEDKLVFIQRGVDVPEKGDYRNLPVHQAAKKIKLATQAKVYFDPSHTFGPKLKSKISEGVIEAMRMKTDENTYLYDGILIEVGRSKTDTKQHLNIKEFEELCHRLAEFRDLAGPEK